MPAPVPAPEAPDERIEAVEAGATPAPKRTSRTRMLDGKSAVAPYARRLNDRVRAAPVLARGQDKVGAVWTRLVEAFCQAIEPLLERFFPDLRLVVVADGGGALALHQVGRDGVADLGTLDAMTPDRSAGLAATRWSAVELRLPATQILERKLSLPAASRDFLAPILEHRLDRLTPWRADRVLYGFRADGDATNAGLVSVTLTATSRDLVAAPLQRLGAAGLVPTAIGSDDGEARRPLAVNLLRGGANAAPRAESRRFVSRAALTTGGVLLLAFLVTAVLAAGASSDRTAATQKLAKARRLLRAASFGNVGTREQAMLEAKQLNRSTVVLIDRLSTAIPADTYLKDLTIQPDKVRLVGSSGNAPALIGELEAAGLNNVRFTSTIARDRAGRDDFELSADRPQPRAEDAP